MKVQPNPAPQSHAEIAKESLRAIPERVKAIFTTNNVDSVQAAMNKNIFAVLAVPTAALVDLADPLLQPVLIAKDLGNAAVHGALAGLKKIFG